MLNSGLSDLCVLVAILVLVCISPWTFPMLTAYLETLFCEEPVQELYPFFCGVSTFFFLMCQSS